MLRCLLAAGFAAVSFCSTFASAVQAQTVESCAQKFHAELAQLSAARGETLGGVFKGMRTGDVSLPGRWLFGPPPGKANSARAASKASVERVCVEETRVRNRVKCVRYEERIRSSTEITYQTGATADEARAIKAFGDVVEGRGAIAEVGNNGRYSWLVQRMAQDLKTYISQPPHPALCSGGSELAEFYASQLSPMQKRLQDIGAASSKAREMAVARVREAVSLNAVVAAQVAAQAKAKVTVVPQSAPADANATAAVVQSSAAPAATAELSRDEIAQITARASETVVPGAPVTALALAAAQAMLPKGAAADLGAETTIFALLRRARTATLELQDQIARGAAPAETTPSVVEAGKRALRMVEVLAYSELLTKQYQPFVDTVLKTPQSILSAHKATCTCDD